MKFILFSVLMFSISTQLAFAKSNADMYRTLRHVESTMGTGTGKKFDEIKVKAKNESKQTFYYVYRGAADHNGRYTEYSLTTSMENKGGHIEIISYSRKIPKVFKEAVSNSLIEKFETISEDMSEHGYAIEYVQLEEQLVAVTKVPHDQFTYNSFWNFFVELGQFHGAITGTISTIEREYKEELEDRDWHKIGEKVEFSLDGQNVILNGEEVFSDLIFFKLEAEDKDEYGQWSWFRGNEYLVEVKLRGTSFEYAIHVDILDSLPQDDKDQLIAKLQKEASKNIPDGFSKAVVTINDLDQQGVRVAFVYEFDGNDGDDIKDDSRDYRKEQDELHEKFTSIAQAYDGIGVQTYSNEDFIQLITEDSFYSEDTKTVMGKGYWEMFDFQDVNFYVINYPNKMILSTSVSFSDDWTIEELSSNNQEFKKQLNSDEYLHADSIEVTFHPDDPREVWIKLAFDYQTRSTKELFDIYETFFVDRIGRNLNSKLQVAQGLDPLGPETEE